MAAWRANRFHPWGPAGRRPGVRVWPSLMATFQTPGSLYTGGMSLTCVAISDTHCRHDAIDVPMADVLIHAGDFLSRGTQAELEPFVAWWLAQPHPHKVIIAGNHDRCLESHPELARHFEAPGVHYLQDSGVTIAGVEFWGSPWTPEFYNWSFMLPRGGPLAERWQHIPATTDVVITHGPPAGLGDRCHDGREVGCVDLGLRLEQVAPKFHISGHIHEGYGTRHRGATTFINASCCDLFYRAVQPPVMFEVGTDA